MCVDIPQLLDEQDAAQRRLLAASLVGLRVLRGMSLRTVAERMGYLDYPKRGRWWRWCRTCSPRWWRAWLHAPRKARELEASLAGDEIHIATYQRYARRVAGMPLEMDLPDLTQSPTLPTVTLRQRAHAIRRQRRAAGQRLPRHIAQ